MKEVSILANMLKDLNETNDLKPLELAEKIIDLFKHFSMENKTTDGNFVLSINENSKFSICPLRIDQVKSSMGQLLMNAYVEDYNSKSEDKLACIVDVAFGIGAKKKKEPGQNRSLEVEKLKQEVMDCLRNDEDYTKIDGVCEFMMATISTPKEVKVLGYELIRADNGYFVIANKPTIDEVLEYNDKNNNAINFFKKQE